MKVKVVSLNIEERKHLDKWPVKIKEINPDIFCVQELCVDDIPLIQNELGFKYVNYSVLTLSGFNGEEVTVGNAIFSKIKPVSIGSELIYKSDLTDYADIKKSNREYKFTYMDFIFEGRLCKFGTTHFIVTSEGVVTEAQKICLNNFLNVIKNEENIVFLGDFNAPRGRFTFDKISEIYTDHIPKNITTTIDQNLHRKKGIQFVVDGFFTSKHIKVENAELIDGVSDHLLVTGEVMV